MRTTWAGVVLVASVAITGCRIESKEQSAGVPDAARATQVPDRLELGVAATPAGIASIDIDANPAGAGLPDGEGTHAQGMPIYAQKCASCHGAKGEGLATYPKLVSADTLAGFPFGKDASIPKTVGNYWPYATTVYDYVHRTMPFTAPGSLTPNETYALVAWLLAENRIVPRTAVMSASTLPKVQMPARRFFVIDDRTGGQPFR